MKHDQATTLVYMPSRARLALWLSGYVIFMAFVLFFITYWLRHPGSSDQTARVVVISSVVLVGLVVVLVCAAIVYRMVRLIPSIIVSREGIVDNASLIYTGVGFVPWKEIADIKVRHANMHPTSSIFRHQVLAITPKNPLFRTKLPLSAHIQQMMVRAATGSPSWHISIPRFMLPDDAVAVCQEIQDAYERWYPHTSHPVRFT